MKYTLLIILQATVTAAQAQTVYPDLVGRELKDAPQETYYPNRVLSYEEARDTMYARIDLLPDR